MMRILVFCFLALLTDSCSTSNTLSLAETQTWRVYATSSPMVFDAIHRFCEKEHFVLMRFEQDAGRILGRKTAMDTVAMKERTVLMAMAISQLDSVRCVVDARFNFANEKGRYSQRDEQILVRNFGLLFDYLSSLFHSS